MVAAAIFFAATARAERVGLAERPLRSGRVGLVLVADGAAGPRTIWLGEWAGCRPIRVRPPVLEGRDCAGRRIEVAATPDGWVVRLPELVLGRLPFPVDGFLSDAAAHSGAAALPGVVLVGIGSSVDDSVGGRLLESVRLIGVDGAARTLATAMANGPCRFDPVGYRQIVGRGPAPDVILPFTCSDGILQVAREPTGLRVEQTNRAGGFVTLARVELSKETVVVVYPDAL